MRMLDFFSWNALSSVEHGFGARTSTGGAMWSITESAGNSENPADYTKEQLEGIEKKVKENVSYAIGNIYRTHPFFAGAATKLKYVYTYRVDTAAVDGSHMFINPLFFNNLKMKSIEWVVMHEIMHCMLLHFLRKSGRNHLKWNHATDYEINLIISQEMNYYPKDDAGLEGTLYDEGYKGMAAEEIYDIIPNPEEPPKGPRGPTGPTGIGTGPEGTGPEGTGPGPGRPGRPGKGEGPGGILTPEEGRKILEEEDITENPQIRGTEEDWVKQMKEGAKEREKQRGSGGREGHYGTKILDELLAKLLKPKVNWRKQLAKYIGSAKYREEYRIPSRRYVHRGEIRSGIKSSDEALNNVVFAMDTSGSMIPYAEPVFVELMEILKQDKIHNLVAVYFDTGITSTEKLERGEKPDPKAMKGGGGTLFAPVIGWINRKMKSAELVVIVTDGDNADTEDVERMRRPSWAKNCIWVIIDSPLKEVPFGKAVYIDSKDI